MNYVIIGNSAAAIGCIEGIRKIDEEGSITLISSENHHTYSRPLISYLLYGKTDEERMKYRPDSFYSDNKVKTLLGRTVTSIDSEKRTVTVDGKDKIKYDKLLVATGSRPFVPPMDGLENVKNKFSFMTLDDAKALEKALSPESRVLIVGAGLIGLKCAEGINHLVKKLTVIDLAPRILPRNLDEKGSSMIQKHMEKSGVEFFLGTSVKHFDENKAQLTNGKTVEFDVLVLAVGVRPNTELVAEAGGKVNKGICINQFCQTSLSNVYAAGDCTESHDITDGQDRVLALLPNAYMQGETAGMHMAGAEKPYDKAIPMNAGGFFGLHIITSGLVETGDCDEYVSESNGNYKKLIYKDNLLKGYMLVGDVSRAGIYTKLIREQIPLDTIDFELIKEKPQLMAFSRADRAEQLGGVR